MPNPYQKARTIAGFLILSLSLNANAQDKADTVSRDYVINLKGDTIKGPI